MNNKELDYAKELRKTMKIIIGSIALVCIVYVVAKILLDIFLT